MLGEPIIDQELMDTRAQNYRPIVHITPGRRAGVASRAAKFLPRAIPTKIGKQHPREWRPLCGDEAGRV